MKKLLLLLPLLISCHQNFVTTEYSSINGTTITADCHNGSIDSCKEFAAEQCKISKIDYIKEDDYTGWIKVIATCSDAK